MDFLYMSIVINNKAQKPEIMHGRLSQVAHGCLVSVALSYQKHDLMVAF